MKKIIAFFLALAISIVAYGQTIDTEKSVVEFSVSNMKFRTVKGTISGMKGEVKFNAEDLTGSRFSTSVDVSTIDTESKKRDAHLKNEDFFEVETYPTLSFESQEVSNTDSGYKVTGDLTIKNITKKVEIPFTISQVDGQIQLRGDIVIGRLKYNVGTDTGTTMVGDEITVTIICVLNPE